MPTTEWLNKYKSIKEKLFCKTDLDDHFTEKVIGNMGVDVLNIGAVHFPTGTIFACDPLVELEDTPPFIQTIPPSTCLASAQLTSPPRSRSGYPK